MRKKFILFSLLMFTTTSYSLKAPKNYSIKYFHNFSSIDGFVQIPKGGQFGTTSDKRPTFEELGIKRINYPELTLATKWENFGLYLRIKYNSFKGDSILSSDLKTHDIQLKKGDKISTRHLHNFYTLGLSYDFPVTKKFTIIPKIDFSAYQFSYKFSATGSKIVNNDERKFNAGTIRVGGKIKYTYNENLIFSLNSMYHIPHDSIKSSLETSLVASYNLYRNENKELNLLVGLSYDQFKYKDTQKDMQNFINYKSKPIYKLGLEFKF